MRLTLRHIQTHTRLFGSNIKMREVWVQENLETGRGDKISENHLNLFKDIYKTNHL